MSLPPCLSWFKWLLSRRISLCKNKCYCYKFEAKLHITPWSSEISQDLIQMISSIECVFSRKYALDFVVVYIFCDVPCVYLTVCFNQVVFYKTGPLVYSYLCHSYHKGGVGNCRCIISVSITKLHTPAEQQTVQLGKRMWCMCRHPNMD